MEKFEEKLRIAAEKNPDYKWISGSHLYGTATNNSDIDIRGHVLPPLEYLLGVAQFKSIDCDGDDHKIYNLQHFLKLALIGDPLVSEGFFAPKNKIVHISPIGQRILDLRDDLISNAIYGRIMGYSNGEWRKAMAQKIVPTKRKKDKQDVINDIRNLWHPDKDIMDDIIQKLESLDEIKIVSSTSQLGSKRRADIEKYGYCRKSAAHAIRLVRQVTLLMQTGKIIFPSPDAELLLDIRNGKFSIKELQQMRDNSVNEAEKVREYSVLPDKPNSKKVWKEFFEITKESIIGELTSQG
jgi:uncharacterized protein